MKVYISADIEGVADLASFVEAGQENPQLYTRGMEQMSREVGAACRGAVQAGAQVVTVKDAHGAGLNIFHEYLPEEAELFGGSAAAHIPWWGRSTPAMTQSFLLDIMTRQDRRATQWPTPSVAAYPGSNN